MCVVDLFKPKYTHELFVGEDALWSVLSKNRTIKAGFVERYIDKPWDWERLSKDGDPWIVALFPDKPWVWGKEPVIKSGLQLYQRGISCNYYATMNQLTTKDLIGVISQYPTWIGDWKQYRTVHALDDEDSVFYDWFYHSYVDTSLYKLTGMFYMHTDLDGWVGTRVNTPIDRDIASTQFL
jgi:hypothetical protein